LYWGVCGSCLGKDKRENKNSSVAPIASYQCPICKVALNPKNLERHLSKVHQHKPVQSSFQKTSRSSPNKVNKNSDQRTKKVTGGMKNSYQRARQMLGQGWVKMADGLAKIRNEKLYLVAGCTSFKQWVSKFLNVTSRTASKYVRLAENYKLSRASTIMKRLGMSKLFWATYLPPNVFEYFKQTGNLKPIGDEEIPNEVIASMSVRKFSELVMALKHE
jgi:uncharacterized protein YlaI